MIYSIGDIVDFSALHWQSDWNGYEVGFDDVLVVGLYSETSFDCDYYINSETGEVLEVLTEEGED